MKTIDLIAGARPNFVKLAPVQRALSELPDITPRIVHTGQHYDRAMSDVFFEQLGIPEPDVHLHVGSGSHGAQTAKILERYEQHLLESPPDLVVVFGDVNSTVACALAAVKLGIPIAHVEAGLRSFDRTMPEEINRILTDSMADLLLVTEGSGLENLEKEGCAAQRIHLVGNVMIDTLLRNLPKARELRRARALGLAEGEPYGLVTLHRPANVDDPAVLGPIIDLLHEQSQRLPLLFPMHPRTRKVAEQHAIDLEPSDSKVQIIEAQPYLDFLSLMHGATLVLTDSGGIQEETSVLGVPCLTMRANTERPVTTEIGTSRLLGSSVEAVRAAFDEVLAGQWPRGTDIPLWDGKAGPRVAQQLASFLENA